MSIRSQLRMLSLWMCVSASAFAQQPIVPSAVPGAPTFRLGDAITPRAYAARLAIDPSRTDFDGEISIEIRINRALETLWLNGTDLVIGTATLETAGRRIDLTAVSSGKDFIGFTAKEALPAGEARLQIAYKGRFEPVDTRGLFRQQEGHDWYVTSQFETMNARRAFPCFDEPGWKTPWQLTLDVPAALVTVSNTPIVDETAFPDGAKRVRFAPTPPLPSYLIAMAVGPFDVVDGGTAGRKKTPLRYFAPRGRGAEARYAKQITPRLVELLEDYFGMAYPFEKLDSVSIPQTVGFGAMENVGMITYSGRLILAKPYEETERHKRRYASVAAHEIAHQWFGDLVTLAWWDDVWLNESFATWLADKTLTRFEPKEADIWYRGYARSRALTLDRLASTRRVHNPVVVEDDVITAFDAISYQKGSQVLSMFEAALTPERFRNGVRTYLKRHSFGSATAKDFIGALAEAAGGQGQDQENTVAAFRAFIEQPGSPLIDVDVDCTSTPSLRLEQSRLKPVGSTAPGNERWQTPACFRYAEKGNVKSRCGSVPNGVSTLTLDGAKCPAWIVANVGGAGYYVARYSPPLREKLLRRARQVPVGEATALVRDTAVMVESGLLPIDTALAIAEKFITHPSPVVRHTTVDLLQALQDEWLNGAERTRYARIMKTQVVPQARRLGWLGKSNAPNEPSGTRGLRSAILTLAADRGAALALRNDAARLARVWLKKRDALSAEIAEAVLKTAATFADAELFSALENEALATVDRNDRTLLLTALLKVRAPNLRERALALVLNDRVAGRDAFEALNSALDDETNRFPTVAYWRDHFAALDAKLPAETGTWLIQSGGKLCRAEQRDVFKTFLEEKSRKYPGGEQLYGQALERINLCIAARQAGATKKLATVRPQ